MKGSENTVQYPDAEFRAEMEELYREAFVRVTRRALSIAEVATESPEHEAVALLLGLLRDHEPPREILRGETIGASYKQLAYVAHRVGMSKEQRQTWYKVAEAIPLSQAHAGHLIARLDDRDEEIEALESAFHGDPASEEQT